MNLYDDMRNDNTRASARKCRETSNGSFLIDEVDVLCLVSWVIAMFDDVKKGPGGL
jgi:hypothetical protein